jgi:hypothetical protein
MVTAGNTNFPNGRLGNKGASLEDAIGKLLVEAAN